MILLVAVALVLLSVPLTGGRLSRLNAIRFSRSRLLVAAIVLQFVIMGVLPDALPEGVAAVLHVGSFVLALGFVFANRTVVGLPVLALGGLCNMVAIATNGGVMPASPTALRIAGLAARTPGEFRNSAAVHHPRLAWLGDVFAIPKDWPFANVFSVGDAILVVGAAILVHSICHAPLVNQEQTA